MGAVTSHAKKQPADIAHPAVTPSGMALKRARLHHYHASACLHCVDEGPETMAAAKPTTYGRHNSARGLVR